MTPHRFGAPVFAVCAALLAAPAWAQYTPADEGQRPAASGPRVLPETFIRGFDPVTVYFDADQVDARGPADNGGAFLSFTPAWPGAYSWVDKRTLQFRPAEAWPALARFHVTAKGTRHVLTTMMSPPVAMSPTSGSEGLKPFRVVTLTFPQMLPAASLKSMLSLELRELPGLADGPRKKVQHFALAPLPRASQKDPATWAITLDDEVPEGTLLVVSVSLGLGREGATLWTGRASTRLPFALQSVRCGNAEFPLVGGASTPKDLALGCGSRGDMPQLVFSAPVADVSLTSLRKLVQLEPAVPDLHFTPYGTRLQLVGKFIPDTLYTLTLGNAPLHDDAGRALREVVPAQVYFHLGWKASFLRFSQSTALLEAKGPRMVPMQGYGESRADVRVYRVDPLHTGLWPFPDSPVVVDEQSSPPFPGEEPEVPVNPTGVDVDSLKRHIRLLGSPLISTVASLPLTDTSTKQNAGAAARAGTVRFGLDLGPMLDPAVGANRPGTYLVGLRRLTGRPERSYVRVQITNLSLTAVEETDKAVLYVRALDTGSAVRGATIRLEGMTIATAASPSVRVVDERTTDGEGRVVFGPRAWASLNRVAVIKGDDTLVFDPNESLPTFANAHWSNTSQWLRWMLSTTIPPPPNDATLGFVFTERPIYKPGEPVFLKGYARRKVSGGLQLVEAKSVKLKVRGPDGSEYPVALTASALGVAGTFDEKGAPTGEFTAELSVSDAVVARRTFRIEAYRVPTFEVQLSHAQRVRNDGPFKVKALARYYAGGSVANQPIVWSITQRPYHWAPKGLPGFLFAASTQFARAPSTTLPTSTSQQGELDDTGGADITLNPQLDFDGTGRIYRVEATVTGADAQPVTSATEVKALPPFVLGLKVPRYVEKATELKPEVVALGIDEKPVKGLDVQVRVVRRVWRSTLRETSFATGQAKYQSEQSDLPVAEKTLKTGDAPVVQVFPITESGVYVVELLARDALGRVQTLSADLYIGGQTPQSWQKSRDGVFEVKPDKSSYAPGDVAHLVVQSPYTTAQALVVLEEPSGNRYLWKDISGARAVIDVPVTERHAPNLPVHVVVMRGRLPGGTTDDARYKPATVATSLELEVDSMKHRAVVSVQHPEQARPGTTHDFTVTLSDDQKRPLAGEVTLWLVDEAVLSLAKEGPMDPLSEMLPRNARSVSIRDSRNLVVGRLAELEENPGGDGADEDAEGGKRLVRKEFKTVPYYAATLQIPPSGKLVVPIRLSDDLTTFKVRATAVAGPMRFGFKQSSLRVRLPVLVQPQLPRFVRMRDSFFAGGVARVVEGPDGAGTIDVSVAGAVDGKNTSAERVELKSTKALSVLTPMTVRTIPVSAEASLTVRMGVTRQVDNAKDAFEVKLPILPDRPEERAAQFITLRTGETKLTPFPEKPRPGSATQTYIFTNQLGLLEMASTLDSLSAYPHGCLEQRMSQMYPDLALGSLLKSLELDTRFTPRTQAIVRGLLDEVAQHQDSTGFVGYWPGTSGNVQLTAQAVEFMAAAKQAGLAVDETVQQRAIEALKRVLRRDFSGLWSDWRWNQQATALRALARKGLLDDNYAVELFHARQNMDPLAMADLTVAMAARPNVFSSNLEVLKGELWDQLVFKLNKGQQVFESLRRERRGGWGLYLGSSTSTLAAVWEALLKVDPSNERHVLLRDAVLARASATNGFGSTTDNRRAITALAAYLERAQPGQPQVTVSLTAQPDVVLGDAKKAGRRTVSGEVVPTVLVRGAPVSARVQVKYVPSTPGDCLEPQKAGLVVTRSLTRYPADGSAPVHIDDAACQVVKVAQGEVVELHAQLVSESPRQHIALVVPVAAGLEPLNPALETSGSDAKPSQSDSLTPTYVQRLDSEVRYYFTELPRGTHTFHFRARATNEGSFVHPAPIAEAMYHEEIRGRGAGLRITVTGAHQP